VVLTVEEFKVHPEFPHPDTTQLYQPSHVINPDHFDADGSMTIVSSKNEADELPRSVSYCSACYIPSNPSVDATISKFHELTYL
jgi:hypothetical protein